MPFEGVGAPGSGRRLPSHTVAISRQARLCRALLLCWFVANGLAWTPSASARASLGQPAPPLVLHTLEGKQIATRDLHGKVVILTFWATWCAPCRTELPILSAYAALHAAQGLAVLGFSLDDPENLPAVRRVAATLSFPVGLLGSAWAGGYGRIWRLPVSFAIDRTGILVDNTWDDQQPAWTEARLQRVISPLLQTSTPTD